MRNHLVSSLDEVVTGHPEWFVGTYLAEAADGSRTIVAVASAGRRAEATAALGALLEDGRVQLEECHTDRQQLENEMAEVIDVVQGQLEKPFSIWIDASTCRVELNLSAGDVGSDVVRSWLAARNISASVTALPGEITNYGTAP